MTTGSRGPSGWRRGWSLWLTLALPWLSGCVSLASERLARNLSTAMLEQTDPELVRTGVPAYLLLLDSMLLEDPDNPGLLMAGAELYGAYAGSLVKEAERRRELSAKALGYAERGLCLSAPAVCAKRGGDFDSFVQAVREVPASQAKVLYGYGAALSGWIQANAGDWKAIAELPRAKSLMERVTELDPEMQHGRAFLYLGVMDSQIPAALGGKPEQARARFEQAIRLSAGRDLIAKVEMARHYARLVFDQPLHDSLLQAVLAADPREPGLTLSNVLAQEQARRLLAEPYF